MEIGKAIEKISNPAYHPEDERREARRNLVTEIGRLAEPLDVKRDRGKGTLNYGMIFDRKEENIVVDPVALSFILKDQHKEIGIPREKLVWRMVEHEKGHFELKKSGVGPFPEKDTNSFVLRARFEDYAIARFLKDEEYRSIEKPILESECRKISEIRSVGDLCLCSLCVAHRSVNVEPKDLDFSSKSLRQMEKISSEMKDMEGADDIPAAVHSASSKITPPDQNPL